MLGTAGTKIYLAPEIIANSVENFYAIDTWTVGCIFMELLTLKQWYIWDYEYDIDVLEEAFSKLGTPSETHYPRIYRMASYQKSIKSMPKYEAPRDMSEVVSGVESKEALDLLGKLLCLDPR